MSLLGMLVLCCGIAFLVLAAHLAGRHYKRSLHDNLLYPKPRPKPESEADED